MKDNATKNRFVELRAAGHSYTEIASRLQVSKQTLINWNHQLQHQIGNLRAIEIDALQRRLRLGAEARLELFAEMMQRLRGELLRRSLKDLPTEKLLEQMLKISTSVAAEQERLPQIFVTHSTSSAAEIAAAVDDETRVRVMKRCSRSPREKSSKVSCQSGQKPLCALGLLLIEPNWRKIGGEPRPKRRCSRFPEPINHEDDTAQVGQGHEGHV